MGESEEVGGLGGRGGWLIGYLTSQQHASVSQGRICIDNVLPH